jgi:hypothetical protein
MGKNFHRKDAKDAKFSLTCFSLRSLRLGGSTNLLGSGSSGLGILEDDTVTWFWIGSHDDYEHFFSS